MHHALVVDVALGIVARRRTMMAVRLLRGTVLGAAAAGVQLIAQFAGTMHELEAVATPLLQGIQPGEGALSLVVGQGSRFLF